MKKALFLATFALLTVLLPLTSATAGGPTFAIGGRGWGHGLGMSQWGAKGLADGGKTGKQILAHFYHGTALATPAMPAKIRVGLIQNQSVIHLSGNGSFDLDDHTGAKRATASSGQTWMLKPVSATNQIQVYDGSGHLSFTTPPPVTVYYENHSTLLSIAETGYQYKHGRIDFDMSGGKIRAILIVPFEQYLYGLGEMPSSWNMEALKAQAIAGRTYAAEKVSRLGQNRPVCNCGVYASTLDQAYVGVAQEVSRWVSAVDSTRGQVSTYNGKLIQALYSSSDGGFTENNENVFGGAALPYLRGSCDPGDWANGSNPNSNWTTTMDGDQIATRLAAGGFNTGQVQQLTVVPPRGVSGRMLDVIDATHGGITVRGSTSTARIDGNEFQSLLGLRSTLLSHAIYGDIRVKWNALDCAPGFPQSSGVYTWRNLDGTARGTAQDFSNGRLFDNTSTAKVWWIWGPILSRYDALRAGGTDLGMPTSDVFSITGGRRANFEHGYITWNSSTNKTTVVKT
jgi:SpoIID/LytB domain protein